jgi:hypothetical protein
MMLKLIFGIHKTFIQELFIQVEAIWEVLSKEINLLYLKKQIVLSDCYF